MKGFTVPVNDVSDVDGRFSHKEHENVISKLFGNSSQERSSTIYLQRVKHCCDRCTLISQTTMLRLRLCTWVELHLFQRYNAKLALSYSYENEEWEECIRFSSALAEFDVSNGLRATEVKTFLLITRSIVYISNNNCFQKVEFDRPGERSPE